MHQYQNCTFADLIGLSANQQEKKSHLGTMGVDSKLDEGSTFYFLLDPLKG